MDPEAVRNAGLNATNLDHLRPDLGVRDLLEYIYAANTAVGVTSEDKFPAYYALSNTLGIFSAYFVFIRVLFKVIVGGFGLDDIYLILTIIIGAFNTINVARGVGGHGLGKHVWVLGDDLDHLDAFFEYFLALTVVYFALVMLIKVTFLVFFMRIFPSHRARFNLRMTIAVVAAYGLAFVIVGGLQCYPLDFHWHGWDGEHEGQCVDRDLVAWSNAIISILLDLWIIYIPLREIGGTTLDRWKKITGGFMLSLGLIMTIFSLIRLVSLVRFMSDDVDPTWNYLEVCVWSTVEINVGIWCLCVPTLRAMVIHFKKEYRLWKEKNLQNINNRRLDNPSQPIIGGLGRTRQRGTTANGTPYPYSSVSHLAPGEEIRLQDLSGYYAVRPDTRRESRRTENSSADESTILAPPPQVGDPARG